MNHRFFFSGGGAFQREKTAPRVAQKMLVKHPADLVERYFQSFRTGSAMSSPDVRRRSL